MTQTLQHIWLAVPLFWTGNSLALSIVVPSQCSMFRPQHFFQRANHDQTAANPPLMTPTKKRDITWEEPLVLIGHA